MGNFKINNNIDVKEFNENDIKSFHRKIGQNVQKIRQSKGLSQLELAELIGFKSTSLIAGAEAGYGKVKFSLEHLYKIATVLRVNVYDFFV
ncbi:MAG: helix-turn-helix transcriptional regulator [Sulfurospirillaceae bacterium]|nr:helix-turn-helix transcriptional regulator [Sulfurospirillaceae bacterium]